MLLVVDIGNTETVLGIYDKHTLKTHWRMSSRLNRTADETFLLVKSWCDSRSVEIKQVNGIVISSVVPSQSAAYKKMSELHFKVDPLMVNAELDVGLKILYQPVRNVGADRICNAVAGFEKYGGPLIIADFGTANTLDVISAKGEYLGGIISLGLQATSFELHQRAAKLPRVDLMFPNRIVGNTTETSIQSGLMWGTVMLVDGLIQKTIDENHWMDTKVIATGGLATVFMQKSKLIKSAEPFLTLEGMRLIYKKYNNAS